MKVLCVVLLSTLCTYVHSVALPCTGSQNRISNYESFNPDSDEVSQGFFPSGPIRIVPRENLEAILDECPSEPIGSVLYEVGDTKRCERSAPFTVFGDRIDRETGAIDYLPSDIISGSYELVATPFTGRDCDGTAGETLTRPLEAAICFPTLDMYNAEDDTYFLNVPLDEDVDFVTCRTDFSVNFVVGSVWDASQAFCASSADITVVGPDGFHTSRRERSLPLTIFGDDPETGDLFGRKLQAGKYTITLVLDTVPDTEWTVDFTLRDFVPDIEAGECCTDADCDDAETDFRNYNRPCDGFQGCVCNSNLNTQSYLEVDDEGNLVTPLTCIKF